MRSLRVYVCEAFRLNDHIFKLIIELKMQVSVVVSTYNQPEWLEKVLWGYHMQNCKDFELIVADDGSGSPTRELLERIGPTLSYRLKHVWHEDKGFRKCGILNKAILAASTDYLIFTDGDCIPRKDFIEQHLKYRKRGGVFRGDIISYLWKLPGLSDWLI